MEIIRLESTSSTNTWVATHAKELPSPSLVYCIDQTAGRGQRGNSWESQPGKNITASILFHPPEFPAIKQFLISESIVMAIVDFLNDYGIDAKVKWPNDIYAGDKKICGILVEHVVTGHKISRTVAGLGININQTEFLSDAPNPVSLSMLTGKEYDLEESISNLSHHLEHHLDQMADGCNLHSRFLDLLWRKDGKFYNFVDRLRNERIEAKIHDVAPSGFLTLLTGHGEKREFAFKEVEFVL